MTQVLPNPVQASEARDPGLAAGRMCFGERAAVYGAAFAADFPLIVCDGTNAAEALAEATRRRRAGHAFFVAPLLIDAEAEITRIRSLEMLTQFPHADDRRIIFEQLTTRALTYNGEPFFHGDPYDMRVLATMRELAQMGDALLFRSYTERNLICRRLHVSPSYVGIAPGVEAVPDVQSDARARRIVVYGPRESADRLALYAYALSDLHEPALFVCRGELSSSVHEFFAPDRALEALAQAAVIIDTDLSSPATSMAFAERGFGIVCATTSGAHEYLQGCETYEATDFYSILAAASRARSRRRPMRNSAGQTSSALLDLLSATQSQELTTTPLVSVIIPTFNRPAEVRACLSALARQDYPNFEVIVVNDAGESVESIVAEFPFARYIEHAENLNVVHAINTGMRAAQGRYVGIVADDDRKYPHHLRTLVEALQASNLPVAHADIILRLNTELPEGGFATYGHLLFYENANDRLAVLWGGSASHLLGYLIDRDVFAGLGFMDPDAGNAADCDTILKLSAQTDFAHVRAVHGEQSYRDNRTNSSAAIGDELPKIVEMVYGRYCPPERELVQQRQKANVDATRDAQTRPSFFAPRIPLERPIPVED